jgi:hypothetical protein
MKKQSPHHNKRTAVGKTHRTRKSVAAVRKQNEHPIPPTKSGSVPRKTIDVDSLSEVLFQKHIDSFQLELRRGSIYHFIDVLNTAADHASRSKDDRSRLPQWLLRHLSNLLEFVFLAPHPPGWFGKVRSRLRQHLLDLVRFQAVVKFRSEGQNVEEAYDLAAQDLQSQGYAGGEEAVRWSYRRILKGIRDVEAAMGESGIVHDQAPEKLEEDLASRKVRISHAASKAFTALRRRALLDKLGSPKPRPEIEAPPNMRLSLAEALLLADKVLPGTEYLKRTPSEKDGLLASLVNNGDLGKAAMAFAVEHRDARGIIAFGLKPGTMCKVDAHKRPIEPGRFFFVDRGLAFAYQPAK